jgi:PncC family amidohydrolase
MTDATVARAEQPADEGPKARLDKIGGMSAGEYGVRFAFGFVISVVAGIIGQVCGAHVGGLFLAFPAILPATLTILEKKEGTAQSVSDLRGATIGGVGLIAFAVAAALLMRDSPPLALTAALVAWTAASALLFLILRGLVRVLGERHYLPEIPATEVATLVSALQRRHLTVATAESCTGGLLGALLSAVPGAGEVYRGSVVTYSNGTKSKLLDIPGSLLETEGAVSDRVARAMAVSVQEASGADIAISITGVASRPVEGKPPGLTYIAVALLGAVTRVRRLDGDHGPGRNQEHAVHAAIALAAHALEEGPSPIGQIGAARGES